MARSLIQLQKKTYLTPVSVKINVPPPPPPQKKICNIVHARKQIPTEHARKLTDSDRFIAAIKEKRKVFLKSALLPGVIHLVLITQNFPKN